ncbi:MAG: hypothetical protein ACOC8N_07350 [Spirochaetota bacterium]
MPETSFIKGILDAYPEYVMLVDSEHRILLANHACLRFLDQDMSRLAGRYCPQAVHGLDRPVAGCPVEEAARTVITVFR